MKERKFKNNITGNIAILSWVIDIWLLDFSGITYRNYKQEKRALNFFKKLNYEEIK